MTPLLTILIALTLTASAQSAWDAPSLALMAASNSVAFMSTAPMLHLEWDWPTDPKFIYGISPAYPTNVNAVFEESQDFRNWTPVWKGVGTNAWVFMTNQMGFFRATAEYANP